MPAPLRPRSASRRRLMALTGVAVVVLVACGGPTGGVDPGPAAAPGAGSSSTTAVAPAPAPVVPGAVPAPTPDLDVDAGRAGAPRPEWLGARPLPLGPNGFGEVQPTPPELQDRQLVTIDGLAPPPDARFASAVVPVPDHVVVRSTWDAGCPVALDDLRYLTVSFWGFDARAHTGELIVHADVADEVVGVFRRLYEERFPIEEMRITRADELDRPPTGDGNNTGAFVCRRSRSSSSWSEHAYGRAVDINPFHNPYVRDEVVLPELASAYRDRAHLRPGMIVAGDVVTDAFAELGWGWGGAWRSSKDYMHFSVNGR